MKKNGYLFSGLLFFLLCPPVYGQNAGLSGAVADRAAANKIRITVQAGACDRTDCVAAADVSSLVSAGENTAILLYAEQNGQKHPVPGQLVFEAGKTPHLYWRIDGTMPAGSVRAFTAEKTKRKKPFRESRAMTVTDDGKALTLSKNGKNILKYNYTFTPPPEGVDPAYGRSGFIHPAWSPDGNILTAIQPHDHYHHYGIWNPWTRMMYDGAMYDLWNLGDRQGTVRARSVEAICAGDVLAGYTAGLDHCIFAPEGEKVILNEQWKVRAWNVPDGFLWDFESHLQTATPLPVLLKEYRYAGFGYRATEEWTRENCKMFTSEGKTRQYIDGSSARWIYITGQTATGRSGLLFMAHPDNFNSPEPLRIWDENANGGRGDAFINFAPTKNKDWQLDPDRHYILRYRVFAFEGEMTEEKADQLWNNFANRLITVISTDN